MAKVTVNVPEKDVAEAVVKENKSLKRRNNNLAAKISSLENKLNQQYRTVKRALCFITHFRELQTTKENIHEMLEGGDFICELEDISDV